MKKTSSLLFLNLLCLSSIVRAQAEPYKLEKVFQTDDIVWSMDFISEQQILFTQRSGKLKILDLTTGVSIVVPGVPAVLTKGQGGLLDVRLDPEFKKNSRVYLTYAIPEKKGYTTALGEGLLKNGKLENFSEKFRARPETDETIHFGSRLEFGEENQLFMTVGDRHERDFAQDLKKHPGKVLLFDRNDLSRAPVVFSLGHRNPQGITFDPLKKQLWLSEHGPRGGDELNLIERGKNYGWPVVTHGREYWGPSIGKGKSLSGYEDGKVVWVPSIAPSGLKLYQGSLYSELKDHFIVPALVKQHVRLVKNDATFSQVELFNSLGERFRSVQVSPAGEIYLGTDSGKIFRWRRISK
ncbi:MAG: PQQ-dependent sugar dehydrogenase [Proteobacteria bacterium]|nr:PQQ-dependent sugar dehydrogenase [Pseudomonadota bacterium]